MNYESLILLVTSAVCLAKLEQESYRKHIPVNDDDPTLVTLPDGQIRGHAIRSLKNNVFYAFQEIPYAAPPIGSLRLQPPVAPEKWDGVLDTTKNTKKCYQRRNVDIPGVIETEDCLYLNVYTPVKPGNCTKTPIPVLLWIHGGAFEDEAGIIQMVKPQFFIDHNIIVVTVNYRLGPLGFLTTEDEVIPGNIGLRDQHFAMQWIKRHIHLFGGDPEKITISGTSAGSVAVGLHVISRKNKGLFRGAILQSGSPISQWSHQDYARFYAFELGRNLDSNFTSEDSKELLKLLRNAPASKIVTSTVPVSLGKETGLVEGGGLIWLPVIENEESEDPFLTGIFHEDIRTGNVNQVPILIGFNSEEELFFMKDYPSIPAVRAKYFDDDLSNIIRNKFNMTKENKLTAGRKLREVYTKGLFQDDLGEIIKFFSDDSFTAGIIRHSKLQSNYTDVYLYQFSYKGKMGGLQNAEVAGVTGVGHGEELGYLWDNPLSSDGTPDDKKDLKTRHRLLKLWSNFVKYLNPTPEKDNSLDNVTWEQLTPSNLVYLNINDTLKMENNPRNYSKREIIIDTYAIPPIRNY